VPRTRRSDGVPARPSAGSVLPISSRSTSGAKFAYRPSHRVARPRRSSSASKVHQPEQPASELNIRRRILEVWRANPVCASACFEQGTHRSRPRSPATGPGNDVRPARKEGLDVQYLMLRAMFPGLQRWRPIKPPSTVDLFIGCRIPARNTKIIWKSGRSSIYLSAANGVNSLRKMNNANTI